MTLNTVEEILRDTARELREHPERWCKLYFATRNDCTATDIGAADAVSWCLAGHVYRRSPTDSDLMWHIGALLRETLMRHGHSVKYPYDLVTCWNDKPGRTVDDVIALCEEAALAARAAAP